MAPELERARAIFLRAVGQVPADRWDAYVAEACGDGRGPEAPGPSTCCGPRRGRQLPGGAARRGGRPGGADRRGLAARARSGAVLAGRYKLLEEVGEGGMGTVWMAQQTEPVKRLVAVKLIKAGMDSKAVLARFEAERQALA